MSVDVQIIAMLLGFSFGSILLSMFGPSAKYRKLFRTFALWAILTILIWCGIVLLGGIR